MLLTLVIAKPECFATYQLITCNGWTPVFFDVFNREIRALEMTSGITVMGVSQIATQKWFLTHIDELTNTKWPTKHADVCSNSHHEYILNALKQIIYFLAIVADRILLSNLNRLNLANLGSNPLFTTRLWGMARARSWIGDSNR